MIKSSSYNQLLQHFKSINRTELNKFFINDKERANKFTIDANGVTLDYSKNNITEDTIKLLINLAFEVNLLEKIHDMFSGKIINNTEHRACLHTALRNNSRQIFIENKDVMHDIYDVLKKIKQFCDDFADGKILGYSGKKFTTIVNIGIGGSHLGPSLLYDALKPYRVNNLKIHFISSVDGFDILDLLSELNPETTLFIISSKTFTTQETLTNAQTAKDWFLNNVKFKKYFKNNFFAVTSDSSKAIEFGIDKNNIFEFWDFIGGRYSVCSSISLSVVLCIGYENFDSLLTGARDMDHHFYYTTDMSLNLPIILALIGIWNINFFNYNCLIISPYNTRLNKLPFYIQQLEMESNGKSVDINGNKINYKTCPLIMGYNGNNAQHAYFQFIHQGTTICPMDIILSLSDKYTNQKQNTILQANAIAQAEALMLGKTENEVIEDLKKNNLNEADYNLLKNHKIFNGNRPSNFITFPEISPYYLGSLISLYEHKTFVQGVIWNINSFDQWGVELGKNLTNIILKDINNSQCSAHDSSTTQSIMKVKNIIISSLKNKQKLNK